MSDRISDGTSGLVPLPPNSWLGLLGGGQLGRMFCMAAHDLGYRVCVLDPGEDSPAGRVAERHLRADYLDAAALDELGSLCAAVTTEFENVPAAALERLALKCRVAPSAAAVAVAQDRIREKTFFRSQGVALAPWVPVHSVGDLGTAPDSLFPGILKVARLGYDGKGQERVPTREAAMAAFEALGAVPCVLEQRLELKQEISVVVARAFDGEHCVFPVAENVHESGILSTSTVPADVPESIASSATQATLRVATALDYVGVLCVEFFVLADGSLLANEMAPRPHNSGHYTIDACITSQFEQQARILAALPLGSTQQTQAAVMLNLLGEAWPRQGGEPDWAGVMGEPKAKLHLYGKSDVRKGRKMGHITALGDDVAQARQAAERVRAVLARG